MLKAIFFDTFLPFREEIFKLGTKFTHYSKENTDFNNSKLSKRIISIFLKNNLFFKRE